MMATDATENINNIIENALVIANQSSLAAYDAAVEIVDLANAHHFRRSRIPVVPEITAIEPDIPVALDTEVTYQAYRDELIGKLSDELANYFTTYYPLTNDGFDEATAKIVDIITNGGNGIPEDVEEQLWQRARDRIIRSGSSIEKQIISGYSARGIQLPAGPMIYDLRETRYNQGSVLGKASTDIADSQARLEIDMLKFAIDKAINSRFAAMSAASDYIRGISIAPGIGLDVAKINTDQRAQMMAATASLYRARLSRDEIVLKGNIANTQTDISSDGLFLDDQYKYIHERVNGAATAADVFKGIAQAALSSLNTMAQTATNTTT